ncbi:hypothetical protein N665_0383s0156 [Sinapis alba]|nr:hypothetical protein N665_0383s0156 [Sinapis alba]
MKPRNIYIFHALILSQYGILSSLMKTPVRRVHHSTPPGKMRTICKLIVQPFLYAIWNERNKRLYASVARHPHLINKEIQIILKSKSYGIDQDVRNNNRFTSNRSSTIDSFLHLWFQNFLT